MQASTPWLQWIRGPCRLFPQLSQQHPSHPVGEKSRVDSIIPQRLKCLRRPDGLLLQNAPLFHSLPQLSPVTNNLYSGFQKVQIGTMSQRSPSKTNPSPTTPGAAARAARVKSSFARFYSQVLPFQDYTRMSSYPPLLTPMKPRA